MCITRGGVIKNYFYTPIKFFGGIKGWGIQKCFYTPHIKIFWDQGVGALADLGGMPGACPLQDLFVFAYIFTKKHPSQRSMPPNRSMPPTGNPRSATGGGHKNISIPPPHQKKNLGSRGKGR